MNKILIIDATNNKASRTKFLANEIFTQKQIDLTKATYINLYQIDIPFLTKIMLDDRVNATNKSHNSIVAKNLLEQFTQSDEYFFITPTWNWSVPAILKAYLDLIIICHENFEYKYHGWHIKGLLKAKKATIINTTGDPLLPRFLAIFLKKENAIHYLKPVLKIMGITDINVYAIGKTGSKYKDDEKYFQKVKNYTAKIK